MPEATITLVGDSAQLAMEQVAANQRVNPSEWSDWPLVDCDEFQELVARVGALESGAPSGPHLRTPDCEAELLMERLHHLTERVAELYAASK